MPALSPRWPPGALGPPVPSWRDDELVILLLEVRLGVLLVRFLGLCR
ncbi:MAG TPA: hypothetical protein VMG38_18640 [Trebonia sp.]|nr:hypothetical protein [Trebonia sp.]